MEQEAFGKSDITSERERSVQYMYELLGQMRRETPTTLASRPGTAAGKILEFTRRFGALVEDVMTVASDDEEVRKAFKEALLQTRREVEGLTDAVVNTLRGQTAVEDEIQKTREACKEACREFLHEANTAIFDLSIMSEIPEKFDE